VTAPTLWDFIPPAPKGELFEQLVAIADELLRTHGLYGATPGEVVYTAEKRGIKVGGVPMADKNKEQRQTSWLPRVMRVAGGMATERRRPSPVRRHHRHPHRVYIRREVNP
jgi:hypothetical protein